MMGSLELAELLLTFGEFGSNPGSNYNNAVKAASAVLAALDTQPASTALVESGKRWRVFENIIHDEWGIEEDDDDGEVILPPRRVFREYLDDIVARFNAALSASTIREGER